MQIVTDRSCDISAEQMSGLGINFVPMHLTLDGRTYSSGEDLSSEEFYDLMIKTESFPTTSQATAGDFSKMYRKVAAVDPEILSIHISTGLSGTLESARMGASLVPEAHVTFWDSRTLSCPQAWQVEMAAKAIQAGWDLEQTLTLLKQISAVTEGIFTVSTLKYLIHGGRISHLTGLVASLLQIRPIVGVEKESGKYYTLGQARTTNKVMEQMAQSLLRFFPEGSNLRGQLLHGKNPDALAILRESVEKLFTFEWLPTVSVGPILGAHTGPGLAGLCVAPLELFNLNLSAG